MDIFVKNLTNEGVTLTAYIPAYSSEMPYHAKRPAMLVLPGGGYSMCSDREAEPMALAFAAKGYAAFVLRYSVGKGKALFPTPLNDAEEALEMIHANAEEWRVDTAKIAAIGFSAGGHLCAALSAMGKIKPAATVLLYPCILSSIGKVLVEPVPSIDEAVDASTPPCFIAASSEDSCVPIENSLAYASALNKAGVPFEMHIFEKGYHGFSLGDNTVYGTDNEIEHSKHLKCWFDMCITWLAQRFNLK